MTIQTILRMGDPVLLQKASPVVFPADPEIKTLLADMHETMVAADGAGLAAPQIGVGLQVVMFQVDNNPRYPDIEPIPLTIMINPQIEPLGTETEADWEGCLSLPGLRGKVSRYRHIRVRYQDSHGQALTLDASDFHARVIQHECDHLQGILYPARMTDMSLFGFRTELDEASKQTE